MTRTTSKPKKTERTQEVPAGALRFTLGACQFAAGDDESSEIPFSMLARSSEPVGNWFYGKIYHDFDGMKHRDRIATDYIHRDEEIIGYVDEFKVDEEGLHLAGALVPFTEGDRASEVAHKQKAGVPYEASIDFTGDDVVMEEVPEGFTSKVNGEEIEGPALIIRQWTLRGVAICPHGMDSRTETQFSQTDKKVVVTLFTKSTMAKTTITGKKKTATKLSAAATKQTAKPAAKPAPASKMADDSDEKDDDQGDDDESDDEDDCDCEGEDDCDCDKGDDDDSESDDDSKMDDDAGDDDDSDKEKPQQKQSRKKPAKAAPAAHGKFGRELKKFTDRFGSENGTKWFLEGKSYGEALDEHTKAVERQLAAKDQELGKLNKRLKAAKTGEDVPSTFSSDEDGNDGADAGKFGHLGPNMSKFAATIKIPGRRK